RRLHKKPHDQGLRSEMDNNASRLAQLKELLGILAEAIDQRPGARDLAQLAKQYRETLREIEDIEGVETDDEIGDILASG
ncbi:MAG: hypothetical protein IIZ83_06105, partial [Oscillospiraceae bacterium]|nr:hypothetical protein [Oscillospiraceae bacterium]